MPPTSVAGFECHREIAVHTTAEGFEADRRAGVRGKTDRDTACMRLERITPRRIELPVESDPAGNRLGPDRPRVNPTQSDSPADGFDAHISIDVGNRHGAVYCFSSNVSLHLTHRHISRYALSIDSA